MDTAPPPQPQPRSPPPPPQGTNRASFERREGGGGFEGGREGGALASPPCDIPSGRGFFTGPWTVTRSSLRMLRRVAAFCRPLRPVLLLVSFPRSRSLVVGVLGLCWMSPPPVFVHQNVSFRLVQGFLVLKRMAHSRRVPVNSWTSPGIPGAVHSPRPRPTHAIVAQWRRKQSCSNERRRCVCGPKVRKSGQSTYFEDHRSGGGGQDSSAFL